MDPGGNPYSSFVAAVLLLLVLDHSGHLVLFSVSDCVGFMAWSPQESVAPEDICNPASPHLALTSISAV